MKALVYCRVSTQEQADSRLGLDAQERACREFCAGKGLEVAAVIVDAGVSASIPLAERAGGRRLAESLGGAGVVVALCQDRLFRSIVDCIATLERWDDLGIELMTVDGGIVSIEDPEDFLKAAITALFAEYERRKGRQRTKRAMAQMKREGRKPGPPKFGFQRTGKKGVHEMNPSTAPYLARIGELRGLPAAAIARTLNAEGFTTARGRAFTHNTVLRCGR